MIRDRSVRVLSGLLGVAAAVAACVEPHDPRTTEHRATAPSDAELVAERPYHLIVPTTYTPGIAVPLVVLLHGYGGSGTSIDAYYGFSALGEERGFLLALPNGTIDEQGGRTWNADPVHSDPFDVEYLRGVIADAEGRHPIDPKRIYVVGYSAGGWMAHRVVCDLASKIAAFVSVAGKVRKDPSDCAPSEPVSMLQVHGTADLTIPYGPDPYDPSIPSAIETVGIWARNDGCSGALAPSGGPFDLVTDVDGQETHANAYAGCPAGIGVELWTMDGAPHHPELQKSWARRLYDFLDAHPKP